MGMFLLVFAAFVGGWYVGFKHGAAELAQVEAQLAAVRKKL